MFNSCCLGIWTVGSLGSKFPDRQQVDEFEFDRLPLLRACCRHWEQREYDLKMMNWYDIGGGMGRRDSQFVHSYHVRSTEQMGKYANDGEKVFLPPSALDRLARMNVEYPMLFEISSEVGKRSHCGVLEFSAEEGYCYMPFWMMENLFVSLLFLVIVFSIITLFECCFRFTKIKLLQ